MVEPSRKNRENRKTTISFCNGVMKSLHTRHTQKIVLLPCLICQQDKENEDPLGLARRTLLNHTKRKDHIAIVGKIINGPTS